MPYVFVISIDDAPLLLSEPPPVVLSTGCMDSLSVAPNASVGYSLLNGGANAGATLIVSSTTLTDPNVTAGFLARAVWHTRQTGAWGEGWLRAQHESTNPIVRSIGILGDPALARREAIGSDLLLVVAGFTRTRLQRTLRTAKARRPMRVSAPGAFIRMIGDDLGGITASGVVGNARFHMVGPYFASKLTLSYLPPGENPKLLVGQWTDAWRPSTRSTLAVLRSHLKTTSCPKVSADTGRPRPAGFNYTAPDTLRTEVEKAGCVTVAAGSESRLWCWPTT